MGVLAGSLVVGEECLGGWCVGVVFYVCCVFGVVSFVCVC